MSPAPAVTFFVPGRPRPQGSKRAFPIRNRNKEIVGHSVVDSSGEEGRAWRSQVRDAAVAAWGDFRKVLDGPLTLRLDFTLLRPKGHFGTGRNAAFIKDGAPSHPIGPPDVLKLARAVEDSLTSVIWRDDAQVVSELLTKRYGPTDGVLVSVFAEPENAVNLPDANQMDLFGR
jgi:Holliday junction resolvase RusA-like endonuclease